MEHERPRSRELRGSKTAMHQIRVSGSHITLGRESGRPCGSRSWFAPAVCNDLFLAMAGRFRPVFFYAKAISTSPHPSEHFDLPAWSGEGRSAGGLPRRQL